MYLAASRRSGEAGSPRGLRLDRREHGRQRAPTPGLIGGRTRLPTIFLFFGILGGVEAYGILGIFLGPVLLAIAVSFVGIYQEEYATPEPRVLPLPPT